LSRFEVPDAPADIAEDMVSAITNGTSPVVSGEEGKKSVEIFNAVYKSSETGQPVGLNQ
jgi:UDP-N-acetyl-2-amino-2-deoxyglucuronate dehydrogenase